ncbi:MAG: DUF998 domain-containing protein [Rhodocyclaceae bacterium]|nr:DUF998 domain-containing protein [Rhodocyclaceae bacterium]MCW5616061.1 DUF998 domain-containing protein [Rhodocyclaceae bacterium]
MRAAPFAIRAGLISGILAPPLWAAMIILCGALRPGFDHVDQYISELGERGGANADLMRFGGFMLTGLMHVGFAAAFNAMLLGMSRHRWLTRLVALLIALDGLGRVGAGVFACEPGCLGAESLDQRLHSLSATVAFLSIIAASLLAGPLLLRTPPLGKLAAYSFASGCAGILFLALMSASESTHVGTGLYERLASGALSLWVCVIALRLWWLADGARAIPPD